jgi:N-acetylglutamate synthase-like GNAT family acetyltransferase
MLIRKFEDKDFDEVSSWLNIKVLPEMFSDSTFVLEEDNKLLFCLTIYFTNSKDLCLIENFAGNPKYKEERKKYSQYLWLYLEKMAKEMGYKNIMVLSQVEKLTEKYEQFGYIKVMSNVDVLGKVL